MACGVGKVTLAQLSTIEKVGGFQLFNPLRKPSKRNATFSKPLCIGKYRCSNYTYFWIYDLFNNV